MQWVRRRRVDRAEGENDDPPVETTMFDNIVTPPNDGRWARLAPVAAIASIATAYAMSLTVFLAALGASHTMVTRQWPDQAFLRQQQTPAVVQTGAPSAADVGG